MRAAWVIGDENNAAGPESRRWDVLGCSDAWPAACPDEDLQEWAGAHSFDVLASGFIEFDVEVPDPIVGDPVVSMDNDGASVGRSD